MEKGKFYITTPIYYPSDKLHIGHTYCTVATDAIARYKRMCGYDVMFLTGTDEHGQKIEEKAKAAGLTPKEFVDKIVEGPGGITDLWKLMNISNDRFIRTTDDYHVEAVQRIFRKMYDKGDIYKGAYKGMYCTPCESFWTESQLKDGKCPDCGREVHYAEEEAYFFRLSKYAKPVQELLESGTFLEPASRVNELINNFIKPGLEDLCVSRTSRDKYEQQMDKFQLHLALEEVFKLIQRANKYIDETAPWQLAKDESKKARLASVLYNLLECLRISLIMLKPFIPESCDKAFAQIGACEKCSSWDSAAVFGTLPANVTVHKGETLFPRLDMEKALAELEKLNAPAAPKFDPIEPEVTIDDFSKCDMRVCKVLSCEAVKKSKKLLKFKLDDGTGTPRQILSGIHEFYEPDQLVGKTVVAILNLPNRKMMGEDSCGMLISAVHEHDGKEQLHLLMLDDNIPAGFRLC